MARLIDANALKIAIDDGWMPDMMVSEIWGMIDEAPTVVTDTNVPNKWISIKERPPSEFSDCIVFADGYSQPAQYTKDGKFFTPDNYEAEEIKGVTHWMQYPEGPKE